METQRSETDRIAEVLDRHQPGWEIEWADQRELQDYARSVEIHRTGTADGTILRLLMERAHGRLRTSVGNRMFHRVLNAALECGVVEMSNSGDTGS